MAARWPDKFAALLAVSAKGGPSNSVPALEVEDRGASPYLNDPDPYLAIARRIGNVPFWFFHGDADSSVDVQESKLLAAAFKQTGATQVRYTGSNNDRDPILVRVGSTNPNNVVSGYHTEDTNLNGTVSYTGSGNDRDPILVNVGSTTPNTIRIEQLP